MYPDNLWPFLPVNPSDLTESWSVHTIVSSALWQTSYSLFSEDIFDNNNYQNSLGPLQEATSFTSCLVYTLIGPWAPEHFHNKAASVALIYPILSKNEAPEKGKQRGGQKYSHNKRGATVALASSLTERPFMEVTGVCHYTSFCRTLVNSVNRTLRPAQGNHTDKNCWNGFKSLFCLSWREHNILSSMWHCNYETESELWQVVIFLLGFGLHVKSLVQIWVQF